MKTLKKIINIFIFFTIAFIVLNILLGYFWSLRTKYKFNNYKPYSDEVLQVLNLNEKESLILYLETWQTDRMYEYEQFTGLVESPRKDFSYVNFSKINGRKIKNGDVCNISFFFYGGETTFGYNVTDEQTFASFFKDILNIKFPNKNYCVFNFGRGNYFSTQENILFQQHILKKKFKPGDFVFFIDGANEDGNKDILNTKFLEYIYIVFHQKYWDLYRHTLPMFLSTLPVVQLSKKVKKNFNLQKINKNKNFQKQILIKNENGEEMLQVLQDNISIRNSVCEKFILNCYTFLQPFAGVHGIYSENYPNDLIEIQNKKYLILKKTKNIIDISSSLNNDKELSYVDNTNYSPPANKSIAKYIYQIIEKKIETAN